MRKFFGFLRDQRDFAVLFLAIILSLFFLFSNESSQIQILRGKVNTAFAVLYSPVLWIKGINELRAENELLYEKATQLALLNSALLNYEQENQQLRAMLDYKRHTQLDLVSARVVNQGISPVVSSILIDVGKAQGIERNRAVIGTDGVVGKTITVGDKTSLVQIMTDYNFRASVSLEESGTVGILRWKDNDVFEVWEIPKNVEVTIGERVITSGFSDIFPGKLPVGEVVGDVERPGRAHKIIVGKAYTDFTSLQHVFVVRESQQ